jgi:hypothetical protein
MRRTPFARKPAERDASSAREQRMKALAESAIAAPKRSASYGGSVGEAMPTGEAVRPGKRTPTKEERLWMSAIVTYGCVACRIDGNGYVPPEVHHILSGGVRRGHLLTLPLCSGHHRDGAGIPGLIARHPWRVKFEAKYGTEMEQLERLQREIGADR